MLKTFKSFLKISGCSSIATAAFVLCLSTAPASAYQTLQQFSQAEQRDAYGRVTVEAAKIYVLSCNGGGENGRQYYIYEYVNRPAKWGVARFRAILPPNWGQAIAGRDFGNFGEAAGNACMPSR
jgi:hypothetical protein